MHHYYHIQDVTDLDKIRDEANNRAFAKGIFDTDKFGGESSIIHHHKISIPCIGVTHEYYRRTVGKIEQEYPETQPGEVDLS